jgi:hypothetical protein
MGRSRRVAGELFEHRVALLDAGIGIGPVHDSLRSRLVQASIENEFGTVLGIVIG